MHTCTFQVLFQNHEVLEEVTREIPSPSSDWLTDLRDGEYFKHHRLFKRYPQALQVVLYYDDLEVCNPLGSKNKVHKLSETVHPIHNFVVAYQNLNPKGAFYYTLGNLHPSHRSSLRAVQLLAVAYADDLSSHGTEALLANWIECMNTLSSVSSHDPFSCN